MKFRRLVASVLCLAILIQSSGACMWDRDTLASEAADYHDVLNVITGRFPRNPPIFYEARLALVSREIAAAPERLELYDDAGVACDRLGRSAEALGWMEKKAAVLAENPNQDHQYRYHANLGTFLIHQWLSNGADQSQPQGAQGAEHIRKAIEINPDAHFGRERVQLIAIEWILDEREKDPADNDWTFNLLGTNGYSHSELAGELTAKEAIEGLSGMITLGAAWESIDIYSALAHALSTDQRASIAYLANNRVRELSALGKRSLAPFAEEDWIPTAPERLEETAHLDRWYTEARKAATAWKYARNTFIETQIAAGKHPDTHVDFWYGYDEDAHPLPKLPSDSPHPLSNLERLRLQLKLFGYGLLAVVAIGYIIMRSRKKRRQQLIA